MSDSENVKEWPGSIYAITLFVDDLAAVREFYLKVFEIPVLFADDNSVVFRFGQVLLNFLHRSQANELISPAAVASAQSGQALQFTLQVDDVDASVKKLREANVAILNGPMDRPWGIRTATFQDPSGYIWEIAK